MTCKDVKEYTETYGHIADKIKEICTNRACTTEAIQKALSEKRIDVKEGALLTIMDQIEGMITFDKEPTYDVGGTVTYKKGKIFTSEILANLLIDITYKRFYLYNDEHHNDAFRQYIHSKLDFEVDEKKDITDYGHMKCALTYRDIPVEKWRNYVFLVGNDVYCVGYDRQGCPSGPKYLGKLTKIIK